MRTNFFGAIGVILLVPLIMMFALKKSLWIELEIILGVLSLFMFAYFFLLLYHGIRFDRNDASLLDWRPSFPDLADSSSYVDTGGTFTAGGAEAGPLGLVIGFLLDLLVSILLTLVLAVVLWLGLNVLVTVVVVLGTPLFFLFRWSVRYIVVKGRSCHGEFSRACWFALRATVSNTLWLYAIVLGAHYLAGLKGT